VDDKAIHDGAESLVAPRVRAVQEVIACPPGAVIRLYQSIQKMVAAQWQR